MEEKITRRVRRRSLYILLALAAVFTVYVFRLFQIQIVDGPAYAARRTASTRIELPLNATRGEILDRNLQPMVVNTTRYAGIFDYNYFPHGSSEEARAEQNRIITVLQKLLTAAEEDENSEKQNRYFRSASPYGYFPYIEKLPVRETTARRPSDYPTVPRDSAKSIFHNRKAP